MRTLIAVTTVATLAAIVHAAAIVTAFGPAAKIAGVL